MAAQAAQVVVSHDVFPQQSDYVGRRVRVKFKNDYDGPIAMGVVVRDDFNYPRTTIIRLDGDSERYILAGECTFTVV